MLYEPGASAPRNIIPLSVPEIQGNEWRYIKECLDTNWVSPAGQFVDRFEREVADRVNSKHAIATVNGTAALHIALLVAGVDADDEVLVSTLSFIAPANAIRYVGAWPVFIDSDPDHWQMDSNKAMEFLDKQCQWQDGVLINKTTSRQIKAIIPVHILGHPCDMDPIIDIARKYNLKVIEDVAESLGAKYKNRMVGSIGDISCFSFNGNKVVTAAGGGMVVTDNKSMAERARYLTTQAKDDEVEYIHNEIGYNYRLTNIQAAMGCAQMEQLDDKVNAKRRIFAAYSEALSNCPGITPMREAEEWAFSVYWMYTVLVEENIYGIDSRALMARLTDASIQSRPLWQPLHCSPAHAGWVQNDCPIAEKICRNSLCLPCSVGITEGEIARVVHIIKGIRE